MEVNEQQPTYEQLAQAYTTAVRALEDLRIEHQALKQDTILERLKTMMHIVENEDKYPKAVHKLAVWHMKQIMSKPKA